MLRETASRQALFVHQLMIWLIGPVRAALWECDVHTVMKGAASGGQRRVTPLGPGLMDGRCVRIGISGEYCQCRANRDSSEDRFRHDPAVLQGATPNGLHLK